MEHLLYTLIIAALALCACGEKDQKSKPGANPEKEEIIFSDGKDNSSITYGASGGSSIVSFKAPDTWTASVSYPTGAPTSWCEVKPTSGAKGNASLTITAKENSSYEPREASITLISGGDKKQIKVTQSFKGALVLSANVPQPFSSLGGTFTVKVDYNLEFKVNSNVSWMRQISTKGEPVSQELNFQVDSNDSNAPRSGKLTFSTKDGSLSQELTIEQSFELILSTGEEIDLGLSRKWARVNLGAAKPEDKGDYFAWGEIATHAPGVKYYTNNYKLSSYYCPSGNFDTRTQLSDDDDAATQILGNKWRMPTHEEALELFSIAVDFPHKYKDNNGLLIKAANGNTLFIPASGYEIGYGAPPANINDVICFWTNEVSTSQNDKAMCLMSHIEGSTVPYLPFLSPWSTPMIFYRCGGMPVRAVRRADIKMGELQAEVSESSAELSISLDLDGIDPSKIKKAGFLHSSSGVFNNPKHIDTLLCTSLTNTKMSLKWEGLGSSCTYKVRPFLIVEKEGNYTAPICSFTTKNEEVVEQWVDLGLSVLWASWNVGANKPGEYGNVFQWGDIEPKDPTKSYQYLQYKFYVPNSQTKYEYWEEGKRYREYYHNRFIKYDTADQKTRLEPEEDAATVYWGGGARTPSYEEMQELVDNCTFTNIIKYGRSGKLVTSKINGKTFFFCDTEDGTTINRLWSSDLAVSQIDLCNRGSTTIKETLYDYNNAYQLWPSNDSKIRTYYRYTTCAVRAVKNK